MKIELFCALALLMGIPMPAIAITVDDFSEDVALTTASVFTDGSMLGGERDVLLSGSGGALTPYFSVVGGLATFTGRGPFVGGNVIAQFVYDGNENSSTNAYGLTGANLTAGGHDRFVVSVTAIDGPLTLTIRVWESGTAYSSNAVANVTTPGEYEFAFTSFSHFGVGADFADAKAIGLFVAGLDDVGGGTPNPRSVTIDFIRTQRGPGFFQDSFENPPAP